MTGFAEPRDAVDAGGQTSLIVEAPVCPLAYNSAQPRIVRYDLQLGGTNQLERAGTKTKNTSGRIQQWKNMCAKSVPKSMTPCMGE